MSVISGIDLSISMLSTGMDSGPQRLLNQSTIVNTVCLPCFKPALQDKKLMNISLEWSDIAFSVPQSKSKGRKVILKGISGKVKCNTMTAIMGPSGAGKTSLMNILAGYRKVGIGGAVNVNGMAREMKSFRKLSCYIMQDDHLIPNLSVMETMVVVSNLKSPKYFTNEDKLNQISTILEDLGLTECKHTRVQKLSGGQKKRLCIAQELVSNPPILFLDEPTSGLDSSSSYQCLLLLKKLSMEGRAVVCTIHQPSAKLFELFDNLYMLADGYCIYNGKIKDVVPFLSQHGFSCPSYHNPADFATEIASGDHQESYMKLVTSIQNGGKESKVDEITTNLIPDSNDVWQLQSDIENGKCIEAKVVNERLSQPTYASVVANAGAIHRAPPETILVESQDIDIKTAGQLQALVKEKDESSNPSEFVVPEDFCFADMWRQFCVLFTRALKTTVRDGTLMQLRLAAHIVVGILIGILYRGIGNDGSKVLSNAGCIFFSMLLLLFASMMPTVLTFPIEMKIFEREHLNHWYSIKSYYLAKTMADFPFQILFPFIYGTIVYWMTDQPTETLRYFIFILICILVTLVSQSLGVIIGAATNIQNAVFLGPIIAVPMLLFSGFFVHLDTIPSYLKWLSYFSYIRYAFEGSLIGIYGMSRPDLDCDVKFCPYQNPEKYLEDMDIDVEHMTWYYDAIGLFTFFIVIRILGYFILKMKSMANRFNILQVYLKKLMGISKSHH
ncbi:ATP-binding cassette sub-family G member 1 [Nymphon striatum]|nr:ATP-binding cassette sub-family G member 1 [Nymphon striatum]